jgi:hypothetical protein
MVMVLWYLGTVMARRSFPPVYRVQTGIRIEKRLLKVLKGLAEDLEISLAEAVELCVLTAFEQPSGFSKGTQRRIRQLCEVYGIQYGLEHLRSRLFNADA